uniref:HAUS6_N domain-containing protein n=1 Tax=Macrostomum lignano TaxID=282301 RepID=A0A1I8HL40_9PLAT
MFRFQHRLYLFLFDKIDPKKAAKDFKHLQELQIERIEFKKLLKQWLLNLRDSAGLPRLMPRYFVSPRLCDLVELFLCLSLHALLLDQQRLFGLSPSDPILAPAAGRPDTLGLRLLELETADLCRQAAASAAARSRLADASQRLGRCLAQRLRAIAVELADLQRETDSLREASREAAVAAGSPLPGRSAPCESDEHCRHRAARLARCQPALSAADSAAADALAPGRPILDAGRVQLDRQLAPVPLPMSLPDSLAKRLAATSPGSVELLSAGRVRLAGLLRTVSTAVLPALAEPWASSAAASKSKSMMSTTPPDRRLSALAASLRACEREAAALATSIAEHSLPELALLADKHRLVWSDVDNAKEKSGIATVAKAKYQTTASPDAATVEPEVLTSPLHGNTPLRRGSVNFTPVPAASTSATEASRVRFLDTDEATLTLPNSQQQPPVGRDSVANSNEMDSATAIEIEQLMASCDQLFSSRRSVRFDLLDSSG